MDVYWTKATVLLLTVVVVFPLVFPTNYKYLKNDMIYEMKYFHIANTKILLSNYFCL